MEKPQYKLSRELLGHSGDVRDLAVAPDGSVVSASRDKTAILWKMQDGNCSGIVTMSGHSNYVSSVCVINPSEKNPKGFILTGSNDNQIFIYVPGETEPVHRIKAHENTVCSLRASNVGEDLFLSSSWDITAKLWNLSNLEKPQMTFIGHTAAVWCVADLPNGSVVTGSADKNLIVYLRNGKILHKLTGHTDCIRNVAVINENEFLSCANDAIIKRWSALTGDCLGNFYGHTNYIYSIAALPGGSLVASSGEDKTVRIWVNGEMEQTILLPATSVWCVQILPNEDVVCGTSDGAVRIFTTKEDRYADSDILQRFEEKVSNAPSDLGINSKDLADPSALNQPGKKNGEVKLVKEGSAVKAYSWSEKELKWNLIGDVTGSNPESSQKQLYNGMEYDYVFSVDIRDNAPPLKLPYNKGEDPWHVAQKFIDDNNLSQMFLEQVANFIIKNSTPAPIENSSPQFYDPFTGGNRYIPSSEAPSQSQPAPTSASDSAPKSTYIPLKNFLKLEQANLIQIKQKLKEFNASAEVAGQSISEEQLESTVLLASFENKQAITAGAINTLKSLLKWPDSVLLPVLDIARLAVAHKNVNDELCTDELLQSIQRHFTENSVATNQMLAFRLLANMLCHEKGGNLCHKNADGLLQVILNLSSFGSKNNQVAIATFVLNFAVYLSRLPNLQSKKQLTSVICSTFDKFEEPEAAFRVIVALGTLLSTPTANEHDRKELVKIIRESESTMKNLFAKSEMLDAEPLRKIVTVSKQIITWVVAD